ncbi:DUF3253 domain-containing protein [Negadavirga shengliensis]|uniref:DUF3253 domain-containing protein n=1 Tax=Negadavirga shengliensis TaxID=1389218 RepID=A0ABV9T599_9BACT
MEREKKNILSVAIMEMAKRKKGKYFTPTDVAQWLYPYDWKFFVDDVIAMMMELYREDKIEVTQKDHSVDKNFFPPGSVKIKLKH